AGRRIARDDLGHVSLPFVTSSRWLRRTGWFEAEQLCGVAAHDLLDGDVVEVLELVVHELVRVRPRGGRVRVVDLEHDVVETDPVVQADRRRVADRAEPEVFADRLGRLEVAARPR